MRVAAIDVGTNSVHLLITDVEPTGSITPVAHERVQVELGSGGLASGRLTQEAMDRGVRALTEFRKVIDGLKVDRVVATATSAVREAQNGDDFVAEVRRQTGIHIKVISGVDEARLIYRGLRSELDFSQGEVALLDLGGGSLELSRCDQTGVLEAHSFPLGHLRMSEQFVESNPPTRAELKGIRKHTQSSLEGLGGGLAHFAARLVGTGGSVRTLARMATMLRGQPEPPHAQGLLLYRDDLDALLERFTELEASRLIELDGMDPKRRRTIPAAAAVLRQTMKVLGFHELITSDRSLRDGLLASWIQEHAPELRLSLTVESPRMRAVLRTMERFDAEVAHCEKVRDFALAIYDGIHIDGMGTHARALLEYSALLHDIGHYIAARDHHKHGQYLIRNSRMRGFTAPEIAVISSVVRYHRGRPKPSNAQFRALPRTAQRLVEVLSAILRMADALDRSHNQAVDRIEVTEVGGSVTIRAHAKAEAHIERWAAERRQSRLSNVLDRPVTVVVVGYGEGAGFDPARPLR